MIFGRCTIQQDNFCRLTAYQIDIGQHHMLRRPVMGHLCARHTIVQNTSQDGMQHNRHCHKTQKSRPGTVGNKCIAICLNSVYFDPICFCHWTLDLRYFHFSRSSLFRGSIYYFSFYMCCPGLLFHGATHEAQCLIGCNTLIGRICTLLSDIRSPKLMDYQCTPSLRISHLWRHE